MSRIDKLNHDTLIWIRSRNLEHLCHWHPKFQMMSQRSDLFLDEEELSEGEDLGRSGLLVRVADGLVKGVGSVVAARGANPLKRGKHI